MPKRHAILVLAVLFTGCASPRVDRPLVVDRPASAADGPPIDRAAVRARLADRRAATVARFIAYRERRVYPINDTGVDPAHVWVDLYGNLCAAATIISGDWGRRATVDAVGRDNGLRLADVHDGPLHDWMLTSGLTHHELVAIQAPGFSSRYERSRERRDDAETRRLHALYVDVERQLRSLWDESLDDATARLVADPPLARAFLAHAR